MKSNTASGCLEQNLCQFTNAATGTFLAIVDSWAIKTPKSSRCLSVNEQEFAPFLNQMLDKSSTTQCGRAAFLYRNCLSAGTKVSLVGWVDAQNPTAVKFLAFPRLRNRLKSLFKALQAIDLSDFRQNRCDPGQPRDLANFSNTLLESV